MQDENLSRHLQKINNGLNQVRKYLDPSALEPDNLDWQSFLKQMQVTGLKFQSILNDITPVLQYYVVYPTSPEGPQQINPLDIFRAKDISALDSENQACKESYQNSIQEFKLDSYQPEERKEYLENLIADHNVICKIVDEMAASLIKDKQLKRTQNVFQSRPAQPEIPPFALLDYINKS